MIGSSIDIIFTLCHTVGNAKFQADNKIMCMLYSPIFTNFPWILP